MTTGRINQVCALPTVAMPKEHEVLPKVTSGRLSHRQMYTFSKPSKDANHTTVSLENPTYPDT